MTLSRKFLLSLQKLSAIDPQIEAYARKANVSGEDKDGPLAARRPKDQVVTPLDDDYELYDNAKCKLLSGTENGFVLIRLGNDVTLGRELRNGWRKTHGPS